MKRITCILIPLLAFSMVSTGCNTVGGMIAKIPGGKLHGKAERITTLQKQHDELKGKYEAAVVKLKEDIKAYKTDIDAHIAAKEIGPALKKIKAMDSNLHGTKTPRHGVMKEEKISEKKYIIDASKRTLATVDDVLKKGEFQQVDTWLAERKGLPADDATNAGFKKKHEQLYSLWVDFLKKEVARTEKNTPGSALVYALKASTLATQIKDNSSAKEMNIKAANLRKKLLNAYSFVFSIDSASGPNAPAVSSKVGSFSWGSKQIKFSTSKTSRTNASLSFSMGNPSYKSSKSSTKGSFKYKSGTKQVPNPKLERAQKKVDYEQKQVDDKQASYDNANKNLHYEGKEDNQRALLRQIEGEKEEVKEAKEELAALPKTITKSIYAQYSYPITIHHLKASLSLKSKLSSLNGLKAVSSNTTVGASLSDQSHGAYSKNDGSVSADAARPPSQSSGLSALKGNTKSKLTSLVTSGFTVYRDAVGGKARGKKDVQVHWLVIYMILDPNKAPKKVVDVLESTAKIKGIQALLKP